MIQLPYVNLSKSQGVLTLSGDVWFGFYLLDQVFLQKIISDILG